MVKDEYIIQCKNCNNIFGPTKTDYNLINITS